MRLLVRLLAGLLLCGIAGAQSIPFPGPGMPAAAGSAFLHYRTITVDHTKVPTADQTNFPVLFRSFSGTVNTVTTAITLATGDNFPTWMDAIDIAGTTYTFTRINGTTGTTGSSAGTQTGAAYSSTPYLKTMANGGLLADATNGYDAGLYTSSACSTKLDWQRVIWSATTGVVEFHFRVPTLTTGSDYVAYLCYDNSGISTDQSNATGTWNSAYLGVWHQGNGVTLSAVDSTSGARNATCTGLTATAGQIDGAALNDASTVKYCELATAPMDGLTAFTVEGWIYSNGTADGSAIWSNWGGTSNQILWRKESSTDFRSLVVWSDASSTDLTATPTGFADATWTYLVLTYDGTTLRTYGNASAGATSSVASKTVATHGGSDVQHFSGGPAGSEGMWHGNTDEFRLSNVARAASWITTQQNNQGSSASTFFTLGAQN